MPTATDVLTAVREELVSLGLVRKPNTTGPLPPLHVEPVDGAPGPGDRPAPEDDSGLVVTLTAPNELPEAPFDTYRRRVQVDVRFRSRTTRDLIRARALAAGIDTALVNRPDYALGFKLAAGTAAELEVLQATVWAGLGRIQSSAEHGYDDRQSFILEVRR